MRLMTNPPQKQTWTIETQSWLVVEPTHLKNMLVDQNGNLPPNRGENEKYLKAPTRQSFRNMYLLLKKWYDIYPGSSGWWMNEWSNLTTFKEKPPPGFTAQETTVFPLGPQHRLGNPTFIHNLLDLHKRWVSKCCWLVVSSFNPSEKYKSKWESSPNFGVKNNTHLNYHHLEMWGWGHLILIICESFFRKSAVHVGVPCKRHLPGKHPANPTVQGPWLGFSQCRLVCHPAARITRWCSRVHEI